MDDSGLNIGNLNPFRYRGYYFDNESGYYYLNSRYYSPEWGRFINAEGQLSTGSDLTGLIYLHIVEIIQSIELILMVMLGGTGL